MKKLIGYGIFSWSSGERRSNRYGGFFLSDVDFKNTATVVPVLYQQDFDALTGKRVKLTCEVIETRNSGHVGDLSLKIAPSRPQVGEVIDLGVGVLSSEPLNFSAALPAIVLSPGDGRDELWIDPRRLYRLHDQTVKVYAEETEAEFSPPCGLEAETGVLATGDNGFQSKRVDLSRKTKVKPRIERMGDGLFSVEMPGPFEKGDPVDLV